MSEMLRGSGVMLIPLGAKVCEDLCTSLAAQQRNDPKESANLIRRAGQSL
jgi:hypothetical protein